MCTLDVVLQNERIMADLRYLVIFDFIRSNSNTDGFLLNYCDGTDFNKHPQFC